MKDQLIEFLKAHKHETFTVKELSRALNKDSSQEYKSLIKAINELLDEARIIGNKQNAYTVIEYTDFVTGVLDVKDKGFAFLTIDDSDENDIYIPGHQLNGAMNKDRVLALVKKSPKGLKKEGEVRRILERHLTALIGTVVKRGKRYELVSDEKSIKQRIIITKNGLNGAKEHDKVQASITSYAYKGTIHVEITQIIGNMNEQGVDVLSKILKHNIDPAFPNEVITEAKQFHTIDKTDYQGRKDYRDRPIITIDGETAKDFDDAVEVYKKDNGNYYLGVHIADVSNYVKEASLLDKEAYKRSTSIYLVDRVIPMLPENLSNNLCSLMPNVDRLAVSCEMEITQNGSVKSHQIFPSVIKSKARMTYTKVNKILDNDQTLTAQYKDLVPMFHDMQDLADILRKKRANQGSINFETDEPYIELNDQGKAVDVHLKERGISERIIEECMLIANQVVAKHVAYLELPFIYRIHEEPEDEKLERLLLMAQALGFNVKGKHEISHKELQKLLQKVENTASEKGINLMMLRSMQKAIYSERNMGHFGLAFTHYTHFTSPIRRYPDLLVHRLLREYFFKQNQTMQTIKHYEKTIPDIADHTSHQERNAIKLERDVLDMKKAEYMSQFIGETFEGTISSVTSFGIYVGLKNTVEGLVHISELDDDYYIFNEDLLTLVGERKKRVYRIGDTVEVRVTGCNIPEGEIDFKLVNKKG